MFHIALRLWREKAVFKLTCCPYFFWIKLKNHVGCGSIASQSAAPLEHLESSGCGLGGQRLQCTHVSSLHHSYRDDDRWSIQVSECPDLHLWAVTHVGSIKKPHLSCGVFVQSHVAATWQLGFCQDIITAAVLLIGVEPPAAGGVLELPETMIPLQCLFVRHHCEETRWIHEVESQWTEFISYYFPLAAPSWLEWILE